ncbi:MAG: hypothetical protein FWG40_01070 [Peptococcaceae bacterium]|nr:hypothetical protein [Peptococcaceae bacterium]
MDLLLEILQAIIGVAVPILAGFLIRFVDSAAKDAKARTENNRARMYIDELNASVSTAVAYVSQTYVNELKDDDKFSVEKQKLALGHALGIARGLLSAEALKYFEMAQADIAGFLTTKIEERVYLQNQG